MFETPESLVIIPIIASMIQWLKKLPIFDKPEAKKWLPAISSLLGIVGIVIYSHLFQTGLDLTSHDIVTTIVDAIKSGLFHGLGASGCYSFIKCCLSNKEKGATHNAKIFSGYNDNACSCGTLCNNNNSNSEGDSYADNTKLHNE